MRAAFTLILFLIFCPGLLARPVPDAPVYRHLVVRGDHFYPPYEFINERGEPDGFNVDLWKALAGEMGLSYSLSLGPWKEVREQLENNQIDVLLGIMMSPARAEKIHFSIPHSLVSHGLFTRKDSPLRRLSDLKDKEVIVQHSDLMHDMLLESGLTSHIIVVSDQLEALRLLDSGMHDAALLGNFQGSFFMREYRLNNLVLRNADIEPQRYGLAVGPEADELLWLINNGLFQLKASGVYDKLYEKWFGVHEKNLFFRTHRNQLLAAMIIMLLITGFALLSRFQVRRATRHLRLKNQALEKAQTQLRQSNEQLRNLNLSLEENARELEKARLRAEESDRLKSSFLNNLSHEIRTPMNSIVGFASILGEKELRPEKRRQLTDTIQKSSNQLLMQIDDIIRLSSIESSQMILSEECTDLNQLLGGLNETFSKMALDKRLKWSFENALTNPCHIIVDADKLQKSLWHLLHNAIKFTDPGGFVHFRCQTEKNMLECEITDNGPGIDPRHHTLVFERFSQLDPGPGQISSGLGIGLPIASAYARRMGGQLRLDSSGERGSRFSLQIPFTECLTNEENKSHHIMEKQKTILVAEDEENNFLLAKEIIQMQGFEVIHAWNGEEAIKMVHEHPEISLVLMDIKMPTLNGYEATRQIKQLRPQLPVIALTAYALPGDRSKAIEAGCDDYMAKPVSVQKFVGVLDKHLKTNNDLH